MALDDVARADVARHVDYVHATWRRTEMVDLVQALAALTASKVTQL